MEEEVKLTKSEVEEHAGTIGNNDQNPPQKKNLSRKERIELKKQQKANPFENCQWKNVAFKVAYIGVNYMGFEAQLSAGTSCIEDKLFVAQEKTAMIPNFNLPEGSQIQQKQSKEHNYTKSGRTDRGVSAAGNVFNQLIRDDGKDRNYVSRLNALLPEDIRILDTKTVSKDFSSRFDANWREYRYFFMKKNLNLDKMQEACQKLIGEHDFRNFCKMNLLATTNHIRSILEVGQHKADLNVNNSSSFEYNGYFDMNYIRIRGTAFQWHQIRCIMSVLFQIGEELEEETVVDELLDVETNPSRPGYGQAPADNLIFWECDYDKEKLEFYADEDVSTFWKTKSKTDCMTVFMSEMENLIVKMSLYGAVVMKRTENLKITSIKELAERNEDMKANKKVGKKRGLMEITKCYDVDERKDALLKKGGIKNECAKAKLLKLN